MNQQQRNGGRRDAADAPGLAQRVGTVRLQLLAHLDRECGNLQVVQIGRQAQALVVGGALDFVLLALDVAGVFGGDLDLLDHGIAHIAQCFT